MKTLNMIHLCDCMEGLRQIEDNSIDLIITSPPYNKGGKSGKSKRSKNANWNTEINYDTYNDDMPEDAYQQWQVNFLNECFRILKPTGSLFYNHKIRVIDHDSIDPKTWIQKSDFIDRQELIWDRVSSVAINSDMYIPSTEKIYWLTKSKKDVRFQRLSTAKAVWRILPEKNNGHPAPFPIAIPDRIIKDVLGDRKMRAKLGNITVLDPFMGSGTTALSAINHGCNWIGFEISENYKKMAYRRIAKRHPGYEFGDSVNQETMETIAATVHEESAITENSNAVVIETANSEMACADKQIEGAISCESQSTESAIEAESKAEYSATETLIETTVSDKLKEEEATGRLKSDSIEISEKAIEVLTPVTIIRKKHRQSFLSPYYEFFKNAG